MSQGGANILFLDGHVEFRQHEKKSNKFPISPIYAAINGGITYQRLEYCP
jgi:prepilin-type processing-associated H-X9-DG protein